jgi:hypothetical protein
MVKFVSGFADGNGGEPVFMRFKVLPDGERMMPGEVAKQPGDGKTGREADGQRIVSRVW